MADIAVKRLQLVDNSRTRADGMRVHRVLPWQLVTLQDGWTGLQPTDFRTESSAASDKQITGILFIDELSFLAARNCGGQINGIYN